MANMTLDEMIIAARRMARVKSSSHDNNTIGELINEGQRQFAADSYAFWKELYVSMVPLFSIHDNWYWRIITNNASATLAFTNVTGYNATGSTVAAAVTNRLQAGFDANSSVTWNPNTWRFTLIVPTATFIEIAMATETSYVKDEAGKIFGGTGTQTTTDYLGSFPEDCTVKASLPLGFRGMEYVEWDGDLLQRAPFQMTISPNITGTPRYYAIEEKFIRLYPTPTEQDDFRIYYQAIPDDFGAASSTGSGSMSASSVLNREAQYIPVYWAAAQICYENGEAQKGNIWFTKYKMTVARQTSQFHNQNPKMFPGLYNYQIPEVKF